MDYDTTKVRHQINPLYEKDILPSNHVRPFAQPWGLQKKRPSSNASIKWQ